MGGLLSAYYLSGGDELFLSKAEQLGNRLMPAFNTSTGLPVTRVTLKPTHQERASMGRSDGQTNVAEAGTLSMEFTSLGRATGPGARLDKGPADAAGRAGLQRLLRGAPQGAASMPLTARTPRDPASPCLHHACWSSAPPARA